MRTDFTAEQLADPDIAASEKILRACTHCGFCTATCPTYVLLGDELDSPRGRIYLIKDMLAGASVTADTVKHIDRCLSCLACMTTCPSGVHYMHLVDHARRRIEKHYRRPWGERLLRRLLGPVLTRPLLFRLALHCAASAKPFSRFSAAPLAAAVGAGARPRSPPPRRSTGRDVFPAEGERRMRVALLPGCAQQVLAPEINEATIRLLTRHGCEVVVARGQRLLRLAGPPSRRGGAGAGFRARQYRRMGTRAPRRRARRDRDQCLGLRHDGEGLRLYAARGPGLCREGGADRRAGPRCHRGDRDARARPRRHRAAGTGRRVAYHSACSMQHGQRIHAGPKALLAAAGFEPSMCRKAISAAARPAPTTCCSRKLPRRCATASSPTSPLTRPDLVATGNIGCITQLAPGCDVPVVHTVELLDWATGGPVPRQWRDQRARRRASTGINSDSDSAASPITLGSTQLAPPSIRRPPAAPRSA